MGKYWQKERTQTLAAPASRESGSKSSEFEEVLVKLVRPRLGERGEGFLFFFFPVCCFIMFFFFFLILVVRCNFLDLGFHDGDLA